MSLGANQVKNFEYSASSPDYIIITEIIFPVKHKQKPPATNRADKAQSRLMLALRRVVKKGRLSKTHMCCEKEHSDKIYYSLSHKTLVKSVGNLVLS
jgi:hypothetical protein